MKCFFKPQTQKNLSFFKVVNTFQGWCNIIIVVVVLTNWLVNKLITVVVIPSHWEIEIKCIKIEVTSDPKYPPARNKFGWNNFFGAFGLKNYFIQTCFLQGGKYISGGGVIITVVVIFREGMY